MIITTHTGSQPEGLTYPTNTGTYKVDYNFDLDGSGSSMLHNHLYLETYGTKFSYISVTAMVTCPSHKNLIWIKLSPATTIQTTQQLVIEVPTTAAAGQSLFANDLGSGLSDGEDMPHDILDNDFSQGFMKCRLFHGDHTNHKPARIVCAEFTESW